MCCTLQGLLQFISACDCLLAAGTLPPSWAGMQQLLHLSLDVNDLRGALALVPSSVAAPLPAAMRKCKVPCCSSTHTHLTSACFAGTLPSAWSALTNLERLVLSNNSLTGAVRTCIHLACAEI